MKSRRRGVNNDKGQKASLDNKRSQSIDEMNRKQKANKNKNKQNPSKKASKHDKRWI
jgi:hypothetical protein